MKSLLCGLVILTVATLMPRQLDAQRELYELRIYRNFDFEKQELVESYLRDALLPALNRMGLDRVGVFTSEDNNDHSVFVLIPFADMATFTKMSSTLDADEAYQKAASAYFNRPLKDPAFDRIESRLLLAFKGMPVMEIPEFSKQKKPRMFELRLYQSHTEDHARRKVKMFDDGEIQIMREAGMNPMFYGQTLIGPQVPNLIYMLSAEDQESHQAHWKAFLAHPEWNRIKVLPEYKDTVSKIEKWILRPTEYSQL